MNIFYTTNDVSTVLYLYMHCTITRALGMPLAVTTQPEAIQLLAVDSQHSPLKTTPSNTSATVTYTPYGHSLRQRLPIGYKGEFFELGTQGYPLGKGYRTFVPALRRFTSPDSSSPFSEGGLNCYIYVSGDPINRGDPTGHMPVSNRKIWPSFRIQIGPVKGILTNLEGKKTMTIYIANNVKISDARAAKLISEVVGSARSAYQDISKVILSNIEHLMPGSLTTEQLAQSAATQSNFPVSFRMKPTPQRRPIGFVGNRNTYEIHTVTPNPSPEQPAGAFTAQQLTGNTEAQAEIRSST